MSAFISTEPTQRQLEYVESIRKRLHLPARMLDDHCVRRFGRPLETLTKQEVSDLLDEMVAWDALPRDMQVAMGQRELF